jgi:hypothetical protein
MADDNGFYDDCGFMPLSIRSFSYAHEVDGDNNGLEDSLNVRILWK